MDYIYCTVLKRKRHIKNALSLGPHKEGPFPSCIRSLILAHPSPLLSSLLGPWDARQCATRLGCANNSVEKLMCQLYCCGHIRWNECNRSDALRRIHPGKYEGACNAISSLWSFWYKGSFLVAWFKSASFGGVWMNMWCHCLSCYAGLWEQFEVTPIFTGQSIIPFPLMSSSATRSSFFLGSSLQSLAERFVFEWNKQKQTSWTTKMLIGTFFGKHEKNTSQTFCGSSEISGSMRIDLWIFYFCELLPGEVACTGGKNGSRWHGFSLRFSIFS